MLQKENKEKVLSLFFDNPLPEGGYSLREISRTIELATTSVKLYLEELEDADLISKKKVRDRAHYTYYAHRQSDYFLLLKQLNTIRAIHESGLVEHIVCKTAPTVVILFGSAAKGEDTIESDIDLFVQAQEKRMVLKNYESSLNRTINIFFAEDFDALSTELKHNILNGHKLHGYLQCKMG